MYKLLEVYLKNLLYLNGATCNSQLGNACSIVCEVVIFAIMIVITIMCNPGLQEGENRSLALHRSLS